jgi:3-hydroxybutyryl-CoA dehydratase
MTLQQSSLNVGDRLPPITRTVTQEKLGRFEVVGEILVSDNSEAGIPTNIHTDTVSAQEMGLARPVASGQMSFAYLHELLARQFGPDFRQGGQLSVTFLKPVYAGDTLTAGGVVSSKENIDHRTQLRLQVWLENQQGEKTSVGNAEIIIPSPLT